MDFSYIRGDNRALNWMRLKTHFMIKVLWLLRLAVIKIEASVLSNSTWASVLKLI